MTRPIGSEGVSTASRQLRQRMEVFRLELDETLGRFQRGGQADVSCILTLIAEALAAEDEPSNRRLCRLLRDAGYARACAIAIADLLVPTKLKKQAYDEATEQSASDPVLTALKSNA